MTLTRAVVLSAALCCGGATVWSVPAHAQDSAAVELDPAPIPDTVASYRDPITEKRVVDSLYREADPLRRDSVARAKAAAERARVAKRAAAEKGRREAQLRAQWPQHADRILQRKAWIGMTAEMLRASWGRPQEVNRTITAAGTREQWVYGGACKPCVYLDDGVVTSIQD